MFVVKFHEEKIFEAWFKIEDINCVKKDKLKNIDELIKITEISDEKIYTILGIEDYYIATSKIGLYPCYALFYKNSFARKTNMAKSISCKVNINHFIKDCKNLIN